MTDTMHTSPPLRGKKSGGRPSKPEAEKLKNVPLRMTAAERSGAEQMAAEAGLTLSAYLRERTLGKAVKAVVPEVNRQAYAELARLAGNLNQLTHHLNANTEQMPEAVAVIHLVEQLSHEVKLLRLSLMGVLESDD